MAIVVDGQSSMLPQNIDFQGVKIAPRNKTSNWANYRVKLANFYLSLHKYCEIRYRVFQFTGFFLNQNLENNSESRRNIFHMELLVVCGKLVLQHRKCKLCIQIRFFHGYIHYVYHFGGVRMLTHTFSPTIFTKLIFSILKWCQKCNTYKPSRLWNNQH